MPCNLYGPYDNFHLKNSHFIPALIKNLLRQNDEKILLKSGALVYLGREVMYVDDLACYRLFTKTKS